jgi:hypothetical protein
MLILVPCGLTEADLQPNVIHFGTVNLVGHLFTKLSTIRSTTGANVILLSCKEDCSQRCNGALAPEMWPNLNIRFDTWHGKPKAIAELAEGYCRDKRHRGHVLAVDPSYPLLPIAELAKAVRAVQNGKTAICAKKGMVWDGLVRKSCLIDQPVMFGTPWPRLSIAQTVRIELGNAALLRVSRARTADALYQLANTLGDV